MLEEDIVGSKCRRPGEGGDEAPEAAAAGRERPQSGAGIDGVVLEPTGRESLHTTLRSRIEAAALEVF